MLGLQGGAEAVAGGFGGDEPGQLGLLHAEQAAEALIYGENGGKNVGGDILFHLAAFFSKGGVPPVGGGGKIEDLGVFQPGHQLLGTAWGGTPGFLGEANDLLQWGRTS